MCPHSLLIALLPTVPYTVDDPVTLTTNPWGTFVLLMQAELTTAGPSHGLELSRREEGPGDALKPHTAQLPLHLLFCEDNKPPEASVILPVMLSGPESAKGK